MFNKEIEDKIDQLEGKLSSEEENYVMSVRAHQSNAVLKTIRQNIYKIKEELESLYSKKNS